MSLPSSIQASTSIHKKGERPSFRQAALQDRWMGQAHSPHILCIRAIFSGGPRGCRQDLQITFPGLENQARSETFLTRLKKAIN